MNNRKYGYYTIISLLSVLVIISFSLMLAVTFAGSATEPDATVTYKRNNLEWDIPTSSDGVAQFNIFGEPDEGEEYPLIHPYSKGKYYIRLDNQVSGNVNYFLYIYTENEHKIPLKFDFVGLDNTIDDTTIFPKELEGKQVLEKISGNVKGKSIHNFEIDWFWNTESDEKDTALGNKAVNEDLIYDFNMLLVIEDNNSYRKSSNVNVGNARVLHRNYVIGYPEGDFRQDGNMTRAEVATIFARILADYDEAKLTSKSNGFSDVPEESWYSKYISKIESTSVMIGYEDGTFLPDASVTRAEFATVCVRYTESRIGKLKKADIDFADFDASHWSYDFIRKAVHEGYIVGYPDNTYRPDDYITRAEVVTVVNRLLGRKADKEYVDSNLDKLVHFTDLNDNTYWAYYDIYEAANIHHATIKEEEKWVD